MNAGFCFTLCLGLVEVREKTLGSLRITNINGNINTNVKNLFKTSHSALTLNRFLRLCLCFRLCS